jgi:microcystin-dependent protein
MGIRNFNNVSVPQTILNGGGIGNASDDTGITVGDNTSFPSVPFTLGIERGTSNQEVVECTALSGSTGFVVTRGFDGSPIVAHPQGSSVELTSAALDYAEANAFVNLMTTKGDILVFTTQAARKAVGADGTALTADSTQASGLNWVQPVPSGVVCFTAATSAPTGWVVLNGQSLVRTGIYANLFAVIGTTYGAADGSHFSVPSVQTRTIRGVGSGYPLAATGGVDSVTLGTGQLPSHGHSNTVAVGGIAVGSGIEVVVYDPGSTIQLTTGAPSTPLGVSYTESPSIEVSIANSGSGNAFSIANQYIALTPIIKY